MTTFNAALASRSNIYNPNPTFLPNWRAALAKTRAGLSRTKVACIGDSKTAGWGNTADTTLRLKALPNLVSQRLSAVGVPVGVQSIWGSNKLPNALNTLDSRVSLGSWSASNFSNSLAGSFLTATATGTLAFTPNVSVDTFVVYYTGHGGSANVNIDGGANTPFSGVNDSAIHSVTVTAGSAGTHTCNVVWGSGTQFVIGIDAYNSATPDVAFWNMGYYGSASASYTSTANAYDVINEIAFFTPHLSIIHLTTNDVGNGVATATAQSNLQTLITACKLVGDVILVVPDSAAISGNHTTAAHIAYQAMIRALGLANNCPVVDLMFRGVDYVTSNALGLYADTVHHDAAGYQDDATQISNLLLAA